MRNIFSLRRLLLLLPLLLLSVLAQASHFRYGNLTWRTVSTDASKRTIQFKVSQAWRRSAYGAISVGSTVNTDILYFGDGGSANVVLTVTSVDVAADNFYGETTITHQYAASQPYTAYFSSCCRVSTLFNNRDGEWNVRSMVTTGSGNNSPVSTLPPVVNLATGQAAATFQLPANDPDGDPLTYSLATSGDMNGIAFTNAPSLAINATTGAITFPTTGAPVGRLYNAVVKVSDGKTTVLVDFIIQITQTSTPPAFDYSLTPSNGYVYQVAPGTPINFSVRATDSDAGDIVTLKGIGLPPGSSMTPALPATGNPVTSAFSWTPTAGNLGTNVLTFVAQDNVGVQTNTSVTIQVSTRPTFDVPPTPSNGSIVQIQPGTLVTRTIQASNVDPATLVRIASATGLPGATFSPALPTTAANPARTQLNWTPVLADWGLKAVTFTAQNTNSSDQSTHTLQFIVNSAPSFTSTPAPASLNVVAGRPFSYTITMTDPDLPYGDELEIEDQNLPAWLTLTDNGDGTGTLSGTPAVSDAGNNLVTLVAADIYHHGASYGLITQSFTINVIPCSVQARAHRLTTLQLDANGQATLTAAQFDDNSTASCGIASMSLSKSSFSCADYGTTRVTLTVTDTYGNTSTATEDVIVTDVMAPTAVAQDVTVSLDVNGQASVTAAQVNNGSSDNCGAVTLSIQPAQGVLSGIAQEYNTLTLTAPAGATFTSVSFASYGNANVVNGQFQYGSCHAGNSKQIVESYLLGQNSATIPAGNAVFGDPCDGTIKRLLVQATYTYANAPQTSYTCANVGQPNPVTLTVTDSYGNVSTATANVTVQDVTAPTAVAQNLTVALDASGNTAITAAQVDNGSADACGIASLAVSPSAFTCANVGPNTVTLTATDTHGNVSTATTTVTVTDVTAPTAVAQNLTVQLDASGNATITAAQVNNGSADACGIASTTVAPNAFTCANVGANNVTLTVTDTHGNVSTATAVVTVEDHTAPVAVAQNITVQLDATGNASITPAQVNNGSADACGIASVEVAPSTFSCANVGPNTVTLFVTDTHGNVSTATAVVTVVDRIAPVAVAKNITVQLNASGTAAITASQVNNNSTDNCGIVSVTVAPSTFTCANYGANTVTLTVKDTNGNVSTTTAIVTVEDRVAPVALAKNITVPLNASGAATITAAQVDNGSSDNCGIASSVVSPSTFSCTNVGPNTVTLTVTDTRGNVSTTTAVVTVTDVTAPTVLTQNLTVALNASGQATITAAQVNNGSFDNCGIASVVVSPSTFTCANTGANTVTLTVTDTRGNVGRATATVTVRDDIAPTLSACPANVVVTAAPGDCTPVVSWTAPVGADNCSFTLTSTAAIGSRFPVGTTPVTYTVTDASGNKATCSFTVTVKASPVTVALSSPTYSGGVNVACNGGTSGSATATVTGGCQPYRYLWSNGQTTATAKNLAAGTYSVTVTDANNTSVTQRITLTQPTAPVVVSTSYSPQFTCVGGQTSTIYLGYGLQYLTLSASATGGTGAYTYSWSPAAGLNRTNTASVVASPQVTTVYTVTATDANGCASSKQFTVYVYNILCGNLNTKIAMCHNGHEICVSIAAVPAQLLLGATLGSCTYGNGRSAAPATSATITRTEKLTVEAYPNPSDGIFRVVVKAPAAGNTKVQLYDLQGRLMATVFEGELQADEQRELTIDQPGLSVGTYMLRVQSGALSENLRLTVQH